MKKILPFVFPCIALIIVLILAVRWYNTKATHTSEKIADFGDNMKVEDLSPSDQKNIRQMAKDVRSVQLKGDSTVQGEVRYEVKNEQLQFTVTADLPQLSKGIYQVWVKQVQGDSKKKAFVLTNMKGGFTGSAAVNESILPVEIVVSKEMQNDDVMETVLMTGIIPAEGTR
jgi:hypothetical protein